MKRYQSYTDSKMRCIGHVPTHWDSGMLNRISRRVVVGIAEAATHAYADSGTPILRSTNVRAGRLIGNVYFVASEFSDARKSKLLKSGDLVTVRTGNVGVTAIVPEELDRCQCFTMLITTLDSKVASSRYYCYWINSASAQDHFYLEGWGTAQVNISVPILQALPVPIPPLCDQEAITHYLDTKTAQIDRKIDLLTQKAALYGNLKQSLINETVTRGLDKSLSLENSDVDWIAEMPKHWEVRRLKDLIKNLESGVSVNAANLPVVSHEKGILKTSCVHGYKFYPSENKTILPEEIHRAKCTPVEGNIIISRMNTPDLVGASGYVDRDYPNLFLPDRLWQTIFARRIDLHSKWLSYLLAETRLNEVVSFSATGSSPSMKNLAQEKFLSIEIPFPPFPEQKEIADFLNAKTGQIDRVIHSISTQIEKLEELRKTLINHVVTGKIKVA